MTVVYYNALNAVVGDMPYKSIPYTDLLAHLTDGNRLVCPKNCKDEMYVACMESTILLIASLIKKCDYIM